MVYLQKAILFYDRPVNFNSHRFSLILALLNLILGFSSNLCHNQSRKEYRMKTFYVTGKEAILERGYTWVLPDFPSNVSKL